MHRAAAGVLAGVFALLSSGCATTAVPGQEQARAACLDYRNTGRVQTTETLADFEAVVREAIRQIREASATNSQWSRLGDDMQAAFAFKAQAARSRTATQPTPEEWNRYFALDRRVQAECADAGQDIGDLRP